MKTYQLTPSGRRLALTLMAGTSLLWCWALWLLQGALGIRYTDLGATLGATLQDSMDAARLIPAGVLIAIIVAAPLLFWSLWQEWRTSYTLDDEGLTYRTAAGTLRYPWTTIQGVQLEDDQEALGAVLVAPGALRQIKNPLSRWLYRQAFGSGRVPLYPGVERRDELVEEIRSRIDSEASSATR